MVNRNENMPGFTERVAIHFRERRLLQFDFRADTLHLFDGRIGGQRALLRFLGDGLVHDIVEQVRPSEQSSGRVDDFEVEQAIVV